MLLGHRLRGAARAELRRLREPAHARCWPASASSDDADRLPATLSGGMRQRVALARTLMEDRPIVLMDEPFSALDAITRHRLQDLAAELLVGRTVLLVTHNPLEALRLGHRIYVLSGRPAVPRGPLLPRGRAAARRRRPDAAGAAGRAPGRADPLGRAAGGVVKLLRPLGHHGLGLLAAWQALVWATGVPPFILPGPRRGRRGACGAARAAAAAMPRITLQRDPARHRARQPDRRRQRHAARGVAHGPRWLMPLLVVSQALPVFALAPAPRALARLRHGRPRSRWPC